MLCTIKAHPLAAQVTNDNCSDASPIAISNGGFGIGVFKSAEINIANATALPTEYFHPVQVSSGNDKKSIWYKLVLQTARAVKIELKQPGNAVPQGDAGFTTYRTNSCNAVTLPEIEAAKITPLNKFGNSLHPCLDPGEYLIQVGAKSTSSGPLFLEVTIGYTSLTNKYDLGKDAYDFGSLNTRTKQIEYEVGCHSIDDATEYSCLPLPDKENYTQSSWHTFTTDAHVDYVGVGFTGRQPIPPYYFFRSGDVTVGYRLYKGDVKKESMAALKQVGDCKVLEFKGTINNSNQWPRVDYHCELEPNTTYSVQMLFDKDLEDNIQVFINEKGEGPTQAPKPVLSQMAASNKLGILKKNSEGITTTVTDHLACNSYMTSAANRCGNVNSKDSVVFQGKKYDLSTWVAFELDQAANVSFEARVSWNNGYGEHLPLLVRLFNKGATENCADLDTAKNLYTQFISRTTMLCLPAGKYTMQVLGRSYYNENSYYYHHNRFFSNLGDPITIDIKVQEVNQFNRYSLTTAGRFDTLNRVGDQWLPLKNGSTYQWNNDRFGCLDTPLPDGKLCKDDHTKGIYRIMRIGDADNDNKLDSGMVTIRGLSARYYYSGKNIQYKFYKGNANTQAVAQNALAYPKKITGLTKYSLEDCQPNSNSYDAEVYCVVPGEYSLVSLGGENQVGEGDNPTAEFRLVRTKYHSRKLAEDLGDITAKNTIASSEDNFSCYDNPETLGGIEPCSGATKLIYRQFYLSAPRITTIQSQASYNGNYRGTLTLFKGKATDLNSSLALYEDSLTGKWQCFYSKKTQECIPLQPGWYTVVAYGTGASYTNFQAHSGDVGHPNKIDIWFSAPSDTAKYNRPYKAYVANEDKPLLWENSGTEDNPVTGKTYTLGTEKFNCANDLPFSSHPLKPCDETYNRVAYYVFTIGKESFVRITGISSYQFKAGVYSLDVRKDSLKFETQTPLQACNNAEYLEYCKLEPGTYTLVILADNRSISSSVSPTITVESLGNARFDHARKAYDFGEVAGDGKYYNGKAGDKHPTNTALAPSNDIMYCTTGAQTTDPQDLGTCYRELVTNPNVYKSGKNVVMFDGSTNYGYIKRNLWYTFVVDGPGKVEVKVNNLTHGKAQPAFAVYRTDEDGNLPFSTLLAQGKVDSTKTQGLTLIGTNLIGYCGAANSISFSKTQCDNVKKIRYYVLVQNFHYGDFIQPNQQVEVQIKFDAVPFLPTRYDHYSQANVINGANQVDPPYANTALGAGKYKGAPGNFQCATKATTDQNCYGNRTLWYKFRVNATGKLRIAYEVDGKNPTFDYSNMILMRENIPGDSTSKGLTLVSRQNSSCGYLDYVYHENHYWGEVCMSPGTYYVMLTGQSFDIEQVAPIIWVVEQDGDFCSKPIDIALNGEGSASAIIDATCHTIGGDFGENGTNMGCLFGPEEYKSTWFKVLLSGSQKVDLSFSLRENTTALPSEIRYRVLYGDCNSMTAGPCNTDALTEFTLNCMAPGSYYVQVVSPAKATGEISLTVTTITTEDQTCKPIDPLQPIANLKYQSDCTTDKINFINQSTLGANMKYLWDFDYQGKTSTEVNPVFVYPRKNTVQTFQVKLTVTNSTNNKSNTITVPVYIFPLPDKILGSDFTLCDGQIAKLDATYPDAKYKWQDGSDNPIFTASKAGIYWVDITTNSCTVRDSVTIKSGASFKVDLGKDTQLCPGASLALDATVAGASYKWQDGSTSPKFQATKADTYWVDVTLNGCTIRDEITVSYYTLPVVNAGSSQTFCVNNTSATLSGFSPEGGTWSGKGVNAAGVFNAATAGVGTHTLTYTFTQNGCSTIATKTVTVNALPQINAGTAQTVCISEATFTLSGFSPAGGTWSGTGVNAAGVFSPATAGAGNHTLTYTVTQNGCTSQATRIITVNALPTVKAGDTQSVCINTAAFALAGSSPAGGSWTGKGVLANGLFNPEQAGIGTHTLTYAYSQNGCGNTATKTITVQPLPLVKAGDKQSVCIDAVAFALTGFSPAGGSWSGKGVSAGGTFTPATAGIGTHILTYTVSQNGCSNTATREITVKALPVINAGIAQTVCIDAGAFALAATPAGGSWSGKGVSAGGMFNPTAAGAGTHTLTYTVSENGCSNQAKKTVTVTPLPTVSAGNAEGVCVNASAIDLKGFSPAGGSWSGKGVSAGGTFTPATAGIGTHILTYTVSQNGCSNKATKTVTVHPLPLVQAGQDLTICVSTGVFKFSDQSPLGGTWAGPGVLPDGKFDAKAAGPGTHELVYTLIQNGCSSQAKKKVTITPLPQMPEITASGPTTFCAGASLELRVQPQAGMSYKWLLNGTTTVGNEVRLEAKTSGAYTVVVYNDCAGTTSKNITITVVPAPAAPQALAARRCGQGRLTLSASGTGNGNYRWYSSAAGGTAISGETRNTFTTPSISQTTTYYVSTVNGNCESPRVAVQAIIQPLPVADAGEDKTIISGEQTTLHGSGGVKYQWSPSQGLSDPAVASPVASPAFTTTYTLTVTSAEGCNSTDEITVKVLQDVSIPNTFTPNNDGTNDVWVIKNIEDYPGCTIEVFNRWGNKVYNSTGYSQPWNGTASNGQELPVTTYFYTIDLKDGKKPLVGSITIIR